jgi:D-alanyl-lipoteichoic acid acyltransferase DltB (MBOAT superfamily)
VTASPPSASGERAATRWDGVLRAREWVLLAVSLAVLPTLLPLRMVALLLACAVAAFAISRTSWRRNPKMLAALAIVTVFVVARQVNPPPLVAHVLWSGIGIYAFFVLRIIDVAVSRDDGLPDGSVANRFARFLLYVFFLPLLFAGPVLMQRDLWRSYTSRLPTGSELIRHAIRFAWGAVKFYVLFDPLLRLQGKLQHAAVTGSTANLRIDLPGVICAWGAVALTLVFVYVGFSGFSDMGSSVARVLGFQVYENFRLPLLSPSPLEFWKRSNISTYRWLMTHVFLPYWRHDLIDAKIVTTFVASALWHVAAIRTITASAVLQLSLGSAMNAIGVLAVWHLGRDASLTSGSGITVERSPVRTTLAVIGTFLFTALVFQLFWAGIVNEPLSQTMALFKALVPGLGG